MTKASKKIAKILLLIAMIFSDLMTPISVLAEEIIDNNAITPEKGDIRLNGKISSAGSVTVTEGALTNGGDVQVTKTVSKTDTLGKYKVEFEIKGKDRQDVIETTKPIYLVVVFDTSGSMICGTNGYANVVRKNGTYHYTAADGTKIKCEDEWGNTDSSLLTQSKWENAVSGAVKFSQDFATINNTYMSLVTFSSNADDATEFTHGELTSTDFGYPYGGTNLKEGIEKAIINAVPEVKEVRLYLGE